MRGLTSKGQNWRHHAATTSLCAVVIVPLIWLLLSAFRDPSEFLAPPVAWFPRQISLSVVRNFGGRAEIAHHSLLNSVVIATATALLATVLGSILSAFLVFARSQRFIRNQIGLLMLATRFLPPILSLPGLFFLLNWSHLINTKTGLVVANLAPSIAFTVLLLCPAFSSFRFEEIEQALLENARPFRDIAIKLIMPRVVSPIIIVGILAFTLVWNEFLLSSLISETQRSQPISVLLATGLAQYRIDYSFLAFSGVISMLPAFVVTGLIFIFYRNRRRPLTKGVLLW